jgi:hypothetical protein
MATRFDGFYIVRYEGLTEDGRWGFGTLLIKDGKIYGGDSMSWFLGEFNDEGKVVTARVKIFPMMEGGYNSVTGFEDKPWDLPDIRGSVEEGILLPNIHVTLDGQRYDKQRAVTVNLWRITLI